MNNFSFGEVKWNLEDIKNKLVEKGIEPSTNNVNKIFQRCKHHYFVDAMIERGWEVMESYIDDEFDSHPQRGYCVCERCLSEIESREGRQVTEAYYPDEDDEEDSKCDLCEESGFDLLFKLY